MHGRSIFCALSILGVVPALAQTPAPPTVPVTGSQHSAADFARLPFMSDPELSPDGTMVASKVAINGTQVLVIRALFDPSKEPVVIGLGESELRSWNWVNNGWLVLDIGAVKQFEGEPLYVTRIAGLSADGKTLNPVAFREGGQSARTIWSAHDGTPRVLMSIQKSIYLDTDFWPSVREVDVSTGRDRTVVPGVTDVMNWYADPSGSVRMGIGYDDNRRRSRLLYRSTTNEDFKTLDRADLRAKDSLTIPILTTDPAAPSWTISGHEGFEALYELDVPKLALGKRVFGLDGYDIDGVIRSPDGSSIAGIYYTSDHARVNWLDPALAAIQADLDKAVAPRIARIVSLSRTQKQMIVQVGSASQPGSYYYYNADAGGAMKRFAFVNEALKEARLGPVSTFRYKARDGQSIEAVLTLPRDGNNKNLPLILMPHGGPEARDAAEYDWWTQFLADRGYAVVQPNYRGSTGYGSAFQRAGDGQWGTKMQDDLNDAVDALAAAGTIDPKRVCIVGASYGGYAALRGAQRDGGRYRCAISYAGVSDLNGMIRYDGQFLNANASREGWRQSAPDLKAVSPVNYAADFSTPVLIMHGKKDLRVPLSQSRRMVDRLKAAGKAVDYVEQPLGDHHFSRQADRLQFLETMETFLKKHNPA
jgi:dipeptidyl aminopeptidase/acylaminoacyl peptidase